MKFDFKVGSGADAKTDTKKLIELKHEPESIMLSPDEHFLMINHKFRKGIDIYSFYDQNKMVVADNPRSLF